MLGRTDRRLRLVLLLGAFVTIASAIGVRLAYWQVVRAGDLQAMARAQLERTTTEPARRGDIYDRSGTVLLATTGYRDLLAAHPKEIPATRRAPMAAELASILGLDEAGRARIEATLGGGEAYAVLARQLTEEQSRLVRERLADGRLSMVTLEPKPLRDYPSQGGAPGTTLASHLLGFVNSGGDGQYGVEQRYQALLAGRPRVITAQRDIGGRAIADSARVVDPGSPGADVRLTIDASLQLQVEKELYAAWVADRSVNATAVVLDPASGEVLAWATVPAYDANRFGSSGTGGPKRFLDPLVSEVYEPGSVMKMFVAAAGYESGRVRPDTIVNDTGSLRIGRFRIDDADKKAKGRMRFDDAIAYSRNVVAAKAAMALGPDLDTSAAMLYAMWSKLGIGQRTDVDVSGEVAGIAVDPAVKRWAAIDLANRSFGQGVAVTPLQLASAFSTMVNGGYRVRPHVMADADGRPVERGASEREQVLDTALSAELRRLMVHVVTEVPWYAEGTLIPRYSVGGKTGTAQIWDSERGDWVPNTFNFSFVGFVGRTVDAPRAVIAVRIAHARPRIVRQGDFQLQITSYQLFRRIALDTIEALDIPPGPKATPSGPGAATPAPPGSPPEPPPGGAASPAASPSPGP